MSSIIVINGKGTVGKSTFVSLCHEIDSQVIETSTIDFVKEIAILSGWNGIKDERGRRFLSDLKDSMERYDDIPNKHIDKFIDEHKDNIIFVNVREPHNIDYYKNKYNALTLLIKNPNVKEITENHADSNVENYKYDIVIVNDSSLEELKNKAKLFLTNYQ